MLLARSDAIDLVAGRFKILVQKPIAEFTNIFAHAFEVEDVKSQIDGPKYALCFDPQMPVRIEVANILKRNIIGGFITPIEIQIVELSNTKKKHIVIVLPKPEGLIPFTVYLKQHGNLEEDILIKNIITPITALLKKLEDLEITHGRINHDNCYFDKSGKIIIGECISEPCGFSQFPLYEPIDRADLTPIGKGENNNSADFHAAGVLCLYASLGRKPANDADNEIFMNLRIEKGSFDAITANNKFGIGIKNFYRGVFCDKRSDRWRARQLNDWVRGTRFSIIPHASPEEASRHLIFNDHYFINRRGIIAALSNNWDLAKKFLKEEKLIKWVERNLEDQPAADMLKHLQDMRNSSRSIMSVDDDDLVARSLFTLDPDKVIRFRDLKINGNAIGQVIAFSFARNRRDHLQYLAKVLSSGFFSLWLDHNPDYNEIGSQSVAQIAAKIEEYVRKPELGFGIERCLYDLLPYCPCQSSLLTGEYANSLMSLLSTLEKNANKIGMNVVDRHVAAYIASKLNISSAFKINSLAQYPRFANNPDLINLAILASAQNASKIKKLKKIGTIMATSLYSVIEMINNQSYKAELAEKIQAIAENGNLSELFKSIVDTSTLKSDQKGFEKALFEYKILGQEMMQCTNKGRISQIGYNIGLRICVVVSYLVCSVVIITIMSRSL